MQISCKNTINKSDISKIRYLKEDNWEKSLWKAVLCQAIEDATTGSGKKRRIYAKRKAISWLTTDNDDFKFVCDMAGYCHKQVKRNLAELIQREEKTIIEPVKKPMSGRGLMGNMIDLAIYI